jgi:hypothetical protein
MTVTITAFGAPPDRGRPCFAGWRAQVSSTTIRTFSAYIDRGKARPAYKRAFEAQLAVFTAASARS